MMKKVIYSVLSLGLAGHLAGCASSMYHYRADYDYAIKSAKVNHNAMPLPEAKSLSYKDDWLEIAFLPGSDGVYVQLLNQAQQNLHVVWNQSVIIHEHRALQVFHNGVKFSEATDFMPNSVLPPGTLIEDKIAPSSYVKYDSPTQYSSGGWVQQRIMDKHYTRAPRQDYEKFKAAVESLAGQELYGLMLTLEKGNEVRTYQFDFEIASAKVFEL